MSDQYNSLSEGLIDAILDYIREATLAGEIASTNQTNDLIDYAADWVSMRNTLPVEANRTRPGPFTTPSLGLDRSKP